MNICEKRALKTFNEIDGLSQKVMNIFISKETERRIYSARKDEALKTFNEMTLKKAELALIHRKTLKIFIIGAESMR